MPNVQGDLVKSNGIGQCIDADSTVTNNIGHDCGWYNAYPILRCTQTNYDDDDFIAREHCCVCGGGTQDDYCDDISDSQGIVCP